MHPLTAALLQLVSDVPQWTRQSDLKRAYARALVRCGSPTDAGPLLDGFLANPAERAVLLDPLMAHGDPQVASALQVACFTDGRLKDGVPEAVLHAIGYLGDETATTLLWRHATGGDYYQSKGACLGLLNLPCDKLQSAIRAAILACRGKNLFAEFLPALAVKTGDVTLIKEMFTLGQTTASTDCNAGLLLGLALWGEAGAQAFQTALWSPRWEADATATGTAHWAWVGTQAQGMGIQTAYQHLISERRAGDIPHRFKVLCMLLDQFIHCQTTGIKMAPALDEPASDVLAALFDWGNSDEDDSIIGWVHLYVPDRDQAERIRNRLYELQALLRLRVEEEVARRFLGSTSG